LAALSAFPIGADASSEDSAEDFPRIDAGNSEENDIELGIQFSVDELSRKMRREFTVKFSLDNPFVVF
jgi:hypothetical protein